MNITVRDSITISASPEVVWDYTQDWSRRTEWDPAVLSSEMLEASPRVLRVRATGGITFLVRYKLEDRPKRTSLAITDVNSRILTGGGGSWDYAPAAGGGTVFTQ